MPSVTARQQRFDLGFEKFDSRSITRSAGSPEFFADYTPVLEPLSLDKALLDVIKNIQGVLMAGASRCSSSEDQG